VSEKLFVDALMTTFRRVFPKSVVVRPSDSYTLGIPDLLAWTPARFGTCAVAIEAKCLNPLMPDPFHKGRRTGKMLKHPFMGPQIAMLRRMKDAGVDAFGIVRVSEDTAYRFEPEDIPAKTGNFTYDEMVKIATPVRRESGVWIFWEAIDGRILGSRHRNHSRIGDCRRLDPI